MKPMMTSYARLQEQVDAEVEHAHGRNRRDYLAALDLCHTQDYERQALAAGIAPPAPVSVRDVVLVTERAERVAQQRFASRLTAWLEKYPAPSEKTQRALRELVLALRSAAQGGLNSSDPGPIDACMQMIDNVLPDVGSPTMVAVAHYDQIRPLLGRGRTVPGTLADVERLAEEIETLADTLLGHGVRVEMHGVGPMLSDNAPAPARSKITELRHV